MVNFFKKICLTVLLISLTWSFIINIPVNKVISQSNRGLSLTPALNEIIIRPGESAQQIITITNITDYVQAISVDFKPIIPIDPVTDSSIIERFDSSSWLDTDVRNLLLDANETKNIPINITVPINAGVGGQYASVVFRVINTEFNDTKSSTSVNPEIIAQIFITVPGNIVETAQVSAVFPYILSTSKTRPISIRLNNSGLIHLLPSASIEVRRLNGLVVETLTFPPKLVLPGTQAILSTDWRPTEPGIYKIHTTTTFGSPTQSIVYESGINIVLPALWIQLVVIIISALSVRWSVKELKKYYRGKKIKLAKDTPENSKKINSPQKNIDQVVKYGKLKDKSKK